ncbi:DNA-binding protein [Pseudooceanicola sp. 216_PA32_1]|uniref:DNA-binding protein n=1 Tax=Pseudooceanicola pacificus TaxID=2676438 RepID=A0A844W7K5_9RHOB|nr:OB-fold domain-containing protein [Pseudooceanicola pacificus]MWB78754.1 DNA-binding protein [Pseudooceanicola pacificus]
MSAIRYQECRACGDRWALPRGLCRRCGSDDLAWQDSGGAGRVYSLTTQHRAPSRDFPVAPPWRIGLVDLDEGPRVMCHLDEAAAIGSRVRGGMREFAGAQVPWFAVAEEG